MERERRVGTIRVKGCGSGCGLPSRSTSRSGGSPGALTFWYPGRREGEAGMVKRRGDGVPFQPQSTQSFTEKHREFSTRLNETRAGGIGVNALWVLLFSPSRGTPAFSLCVRELQGHWASAPRLMVVLAAWCTAQRCKNANKSRNCCGVSSRYRFSGISETGESCMSSI
ncbi:MAG: hypothetical protein RLZZ436_1798 [Planctomycetota bacterium]